MMTASSQPSASEFEFITDLSGFRAAPALVARLGGRLRRKSDLLRALARELELPSYFGQNWDALEECLAAGAWRAGTSSVVILHEQLPLTSAEQRKVYLEILVAALRAQQGRLRVVFPASAQSEINALRQMS